MTPNQSAECRPMIRSFDLMVVVTRGEDAENDLDCFGWFGRDSLAVLAFGIRGEAVCRDVPLGNDGGQPDRLSNNRRSVLSD